MLTPVVLLVVEAPVAVGVRHSHRQTLEEAPIVVAVRVARPLVQRVQPDGPRRVVRVGTLLVVRPGDHGALGVRVVHKLDAPVLPVPPGVPFR